MNIGVSEFEPSSDGFWKYKNFASPILINFSHMHCILTQVTNASTLVGSTQAGTAGTDNTIGISYVADRDDTGYGSAVARFYVLFIHS